jgi:hypothetical protein
VLVEVRSLKWDLLAEPHDRSRVPEPGERISVAGDVVRISDVPPQPATRHDELDGSVDVLVLIAELIERPPRWVGRDIYGSKRAATVA